MELRNDDNDSDDNDSENSDNSDDNDLILVISSMFLVGFGMTARKTAVSCCQGRKSPPTPCH